MTRFTLPVSCKLCGFKTRSCAVALVHLMVKHKVKPKRDDVAVALSSSIELAVLYYAVAIPLSAVKLVLFPFWWLYEHL